MACVGACSVQLPRLQCPGAGHRQLLHQRLLLLMMRLLLCCIWAQVVQTLLQLQRHQHLPFARHCCWHPGRFLQLQGLLQKHRTQSGYYHGTLLQLLAYSTQGLLLVLCCARQMPCFLWCLLQLLP
jgi:hypothetical protein